MSRFGVVGGVDTLERDFSQIAREANASKAGAIVDADKGPVGLSEDDVGVFPYSSTDFYLEDFGEPDTPLQLSAKKQVDAGRAEGVTPQIWIKRALPRDSNGDIEALWGGVEVDPTTTDGYTQLTTGVVYPYDNYTPGSSIAFAIFNREPNDEDDLIGFRIDTEKGDSGQFEFQEYTRDDASSQWEQQDAYIVSTVEETNARGQQIYLEDRINNRSDLFLAVDNTANDDMPSDFSESQDPISPAGGTSGGSLSSSDLISALQVFRDATKVDVRMMTTGGYVNESDPQFANEMLDVAISRKDMATLGDLPYKFDPANASTFRSDAISFGTPPENAGSYGAYYGPWLQDHENSRSKTVERPPTGWIANRALVSFETNEPWFAVAGPSRGQLPVSDVVQPYGTGDLELLQENRLNPIRDDQSYGPTIWGQETLQNFASVTDQLSVRFTLIVLEVTLSRLARNYLWDFSIPSTWRQVESQADSFLASVAGRNGLTGWRVKIDSETNTDNVLNNNGMRGFIDLEFPGIAKHIRLIFRLFAQGQADFLETTA